jgi:hypothetical protein
VAHDLQRHGVGRAARGKGNHVPAFLAVGLDHHALCVGAHAADDAHQRFAARLDRAGLVVEPLGAHREGLGVLLGLAEGERRVAGLVGFVSVLVPAEARRRIAGAREARSDPSLTQPIVSLSHKGDHTRQRVSKLPNRLTLSGYKTYHSIMAIPTRAPCPRNPGENITGTR